MMGLNSFRLIVGELSSFKNERNGKSHVQLMIMSTLKSVVKVLLNLELIVVNVTIF